MEQSVVVDVNDIHHSASRKCGPLTTNLKDDIGKLHFIISYFML